MAITPTTAAQQRPAHVTSRALASAIVAPGMVLSTLLLLAACGADNSPSQVTSPGEAERARTAALEAGAALLQDKPPVDALNAYLDGFHFYSGDMKAQMEAHHYCGHVNEELIQCAIFDGNGGDAKLMGVEYIVSAKLFATLPPDEKALWHSHVHEVKSGQLIAPGIPDAAEHELMEKLVGTYGKTFHTWHTDQQATLPLGGPKLMMGFTEDGQIDAQLSQSRDERFDVRSADKRQQRADIPAPPIDPGANAWQRGRVIQLTDPTASSASSPAAHATANPTANHR